MEEISTNLPQFLRVIMAFAFVMLLMGGFALLLKKLGLAAITATKTGENKRLKLVETLPLDARRRLAIIKCDEQEHLVILGTNNETLLKTDIQPVDGSKDSSTKT